MKLPIIKFPYKIPRVDPCDAYEDGRPLYILREDFPILINTFLLNIRCGIQTDFASIPRLFWSLFLPYDPAYAAAVVPHDVCYQAELWPRKIADQILLAGMITLKVPQWKRDIIYSAVRVGGGFGYGGKHNKKLKLARTLLGYTDFTTRPLFKGV